MNVDAMQDELDTIAGDSRRRAAAERQQDRRRREQDARRQAAVLCQGLGERGRSAAEVALGLGMARRTLSSWCCQWRRDALVACLRGRPLKESPLSARQVVLEFIEQEGPQVGLPSLRTCFPEVPRCKMIDLQAAYRRHFCSRHRACVAELTWLEVRTVWAMDHALPPHPIDGVYEAAIAVRDLASGLQLAWLPVSDQTGSTTALVLQTLFVVHGPPLVAKSDLGSPFRSHEVSELCDRHGVTWLPSPARTPSYNGSCEAGIGSMKTRTHYLAARQGRAAHWASDDLETARRQANELTRPMGHLGPTPLDLWNARAVVDPSQCDLFRDAVARHRQDILAALPAAQTSPIDNLATRVQRRSVRRALVELGLLSINRRSIPLPFRHLYVAKIS